MARIQCGGDVSMLQMSSPFSLIYRGYHELSDQVTFALLVLSQYVGYKYPVIQFYGIQNRKHSENQ